MYKQFQEQLLWQKWKAGDRVREVQKARGARKNKIDK